MTLRVACFEALVRSIPLLTQNGAGVLGVSHRRPWGTDVSQKKIQTIFEHQKECDTLGLMHGRRTVSVCRTLARMKT